MEGAASYRRVYTAKVAAARLGISQQAIRQRMSRQSPTLLGWSAEAKENYSGQVVVDADQVDAEVEMRALNPDLGAEASMWLLLSGPARPTSPFTSASEGELTMGSPAVRAEFAEADARSARLEAAEAKLEAAETRAQAAERDKGSLGRELTALRAQLVTFYRANLEALTSELPDGRR
jgi:hypothetical protein